MSQPESEGEQEVDFGRYWIALVRFWWLPIVGLIVGGIIGVLAQTGGGHGYRAKVIVYLGQPFAPGSIQPVQSLPTRLSFVEQLVKGHATVKRVAAEVGIPAGALSRGTSISTTSAITTGKSAGAPSSIVEVAVANPSARKAADAANALAKVVVDEFSSYVNVKLATYRARLARAERELAATDKRIAEAEAEQKALINDHSLPATEKLLLLSSFTGQVNFQQQRQFNLESAQFTLKDSIALAQQVEVARVVQVAAATKVSAPSKRSGGAVGLVIGLVLGLLAAVFFEPFTGLVKRARTAS